MLLSPHKYRPSVLSHLLLVVGLVVVFRADAAHAESFPTMGARALAMGGAFTAVSDDASAVFWNPAGLTLLERQEIRVVGGQTELASGRFQNRIDAVLTRDPRESGTYESGEETERLADDLRTFGSNETYLHGSQHLSLVLAARRMGITVLEDRVQGIRPLVDLEKVSPGPPSDENSIATNDTVLSMAGIDRREVVLSGTAFRPERGFLMGTNIRYIQLRSYLEEPLVWNLESTGTDDLLSGVRDLRSEEEQGWAADVGAIFLFGTARLGIVGRNLNGPVFAFPDDREVRLEPQVRAGLSWLRPENYTVSIDVDVTENESLAGELPDRQAALGIEKWLGENANFAIRLGANANVAVSGTPTVVSGGLGLQGETLSFDVTFATDTDGASSTAVGAFSLRL